MAKGGVTGDPVAMREAFRQGHAHLQLDESKGFQVSIVAHAEGSATAYFESVGMLVRPQQAAKRMDRLARRRGA